MFGRKTEGESDMSENSSNETTTHAVRTIEASPQTAPRSATPGSVRRVVDIPGSRRGPVDNSADRRLTVGKGLSVNGEITSCDVLVVEGKVEAKLSDGKLIEITESGQFRGSVEIENADIAGRFDGTLIVHGRLTVRATGRISGTIKYGELEVSAGGQIIGEMQVTSGGAAATGTASTSSSSFKSASKFSALTSDDEVSETTSDRKSA
jgi:cytoskeletal protein CcmA (bactofilin family)